VTISLRGAIIGTLVVAICIGLYLLWLWRAEHQVRLHTANFFHAIDGRNWEAVADFIGEDYRDQWDDDKTRLLERMQEGFRWVRGSRITASDPFVQVEAPRAIWIGKIIVYSTDDGVMQLLDERVNKLPGPFEFEWRHFSSKPWDWKLVRVSNPAFQIPADMSYCSRDLLMDPRALPYLPCACRNWFFAASTSRCVCWQRRIPRSLSP
jgi:hypothetical protein